jgi:L-fuconolactonase
MKIDSHQHFWRYNTADFAWISDEMARIRGDFLPTDLASQLVARGIDGAVAVQARMTTEETRWLLELADQHDLIKGVIGWVPLAEQSVASELDRFAALRWTPEVGQEGRLKPKESNDVEEEKNVQCGV